MNSVKKLALAVFPASLTKSVRKARNLTVIPSENKSVISDLFPFNLKEEWLTYFELLNLPGLIKPKEFIDKEYKVIFIFFDENGQKIHEEYMSNTGCYRKTLNIKKILSPVTSCQLGTFACFHLRYIDDLVNKESFMTERGYLGYENYALSEVRGYVHGNFDAVAFNDKEEIKCLGKSHFLKEQEFRLQHILSGEACYDLFFTNTTSKTRKVEVIYENNIGDVEREVLVIPSKGIRVFNKKVNQAEQGRIKIKSKLNLPRPVVFRSTKISFDVFHG